MKQSNDQTVVVYASADTFLRHGAMAKQVKVNLSDTVLKTIKVYSTEKHGLVPIEMRFATPEILKQLQKRYRDPDAPCFVN